ncbi:hypothetical protein C8R44DRAFT_748578 [Mycena epipterygia]|nr:hypothetical protein C8R44DRAFT_748578 [Mycena epipterygia]
MSSQQARSSLLPSCGIQPPHPRTFGAEFNKQLSVPPGGGNSSFFIAEGSTDDEWVLVPSGGPWRGKITVGSVSTVGKFKIFLGGGVWQMLLGKLMLQAFGASYKYVHDTVTLCTAEMERNLNAVVPMAYIRENLL